MAKGYKESGRLKIACAFESELFKKIQKQAIKEHKSFSKMVEELCKVGMLDLEESDALEPNNETHAVQ